MTSGGAFWLAIILSGIVTYLIRVSFFAFADRLTELPRGARELLRMIPASALAALAIPAILRPDGLDGGVQVGSAEMIAAALALGVAWRWKNLLATIAVGLGAAMILDSLIG